MMKLKKGMIAIFLLLLVISLPACDEEDVKVVAQMIESASAVAYNEVVCKHPELDKPLMDLATFSMQLLDSQAIDVVNAKSLLYSALEGFTTLEESDKRIIVDMFAIVIPLIDLPSSGIVKEPQITFIKAFFQGILNAAECKMKLKTPAEVNEKLAKLLD